MAASVPDGALKNLHEDFVRLSRQSEFRDTPSVFAWTKSEEPVQDKVWQFIAFLNEIRFCHMPDLRGIGRTREECEEVRRRVCDPRSRPMGTLEPLPSGRASVWWPPSITTKHLRLFNRFSARALELIGPDYAEQRLDPTYEPRIRWIWLARDIVHSDDWHEPQEELVFEPIAGHAFTELSEKWKRFPEQKCEDAIWIGDDLRRLSYPDWLQQCAVYLHFKTMESLLALKKPVPHMLSERLGNPASYSAKAIELYVRLKQRSRAEEQALDSRLSAVIGEPEVNRRRVEMERLLAELPRGKTRERLGIAAAELLKWPKRKWTLEELAKRAACNCNSDFRSQMKKAKLVGFFDRDNDHYVVSALGIEMCRSEILPKALPRQGKSRG